MERISRTEFKQWQRQQKILSLREQIKDPEYASDLKTLESLSRMLEEVLYEKI